MADRAPRKAVRGPIVHDWSALLMALLLLPVTFVAFAVAGFFFPCLWPFLVLALLLGRYDTPWKRWRTLTLGTSVLAALFVPWRLATYGAHALFPVVPLDVFHLASMPDVNPPPFASVVAWLHATRVIDWWIGASSFGACVLGAFVSWSRNLRMARQIENLPTSKVRSAAAGLSEFRGVARTYREGADGVTPLIVEDSTGGGGVQPFYLEDDTGRIRVDPRGATFLSLLRVSLLGSVRFLCLTRRLRFAERGHERRLMPGDPVYLIGSVEVNPEAAPHALDAERLVVRPSSDWVKPSLFGLVVLMTDPRAPGVDIHHVFFLSDTSERTAAGIMRQTVWRTWQMAAFWAALSGTLLWVTSRA